MPTLAEIVNVHADVDIRNEVTARETLELLALNKTIYGADDDVTTLKMLRCVLPFIRNTDDTGVRLKSANKPGGYRNLHRRALHVAQRTADQSIGVGIRNVVRISVYLSTDADMRELLHRVRAAATKPGDADRGRIETRLAIVSEKTFKPFESGSCGAPCAKRRADFSKFRDESMRAISAEPHMATRGVVAQHDRAMDGLRRNLAKIGNKFSILTYVYAAKAGYTASPVRVNMKQGVAILHRPLQRLADSLRAHLRPTEGSGR